MLQQGWKEIADPFRKGAPPGGYSAAAAGAKVKIIHATAHREAVLKESNITRIVARTGLDETGDIDSNRAETGASPNGDFPEHRLSEDGGDRAESGGRNPPSSATSNSSRADNQPTKGDD
jgi:hypothetical protein